MKTMRPMRYTDTRAVRPPAKTADPHYQSPEHKAWRTSVMQRAGWQCQHKGCTKRSPEHRLFADHIVELRDGGSATDPANGQALCAEHHALKTSQTRKNRHSSPP